MRPRLLAGSSSSAAVRASVAVRITRVFIWSFSNLAIGVRWPSANRRSVRCSGGEYQTRHVVMRPRRNVARLSRRPLRHKVESTFQPHRSDCDTSRPVHAYSRCRQSRPASGQCHHHLYSLEHSRCLARYRCPGRSQARGEIHVSLLKFHVEPAQCSLDVHLRSRDIAAAASAPQTCVSRGFVSITPPVRPVFSTTEVGISRTIDCQLQ
jgi:hypothetical protein